MVLLGTGPYSGSKEVLEMNPPLQLTGLENIPVAQHGVQVGYGHTSET
jgi:hypothetical protein